MRFKENNPYQECRLAAFEESVDGILRFCLECSCKKNGLCKKKKNVTAIFGMSISALVDQVNTECGMQWMISISYQEVFALCAEKAKFAEKINGPPSYRGYVYIYICMYVCMYVCMCMHRSIIRNLHRRAFHE